ncbi:hypothetical protein MCOR27_005356 [Pyricularia oryzae]|nr:hypothetical protein MCOR27_005356 [Pyricularia oryzae]
MKVLQLLFVTLLTNAFMVAANNGGDDDCAAAEEQCIRDCQAKGIKGIPVNSITIQIQDVVGRRGPLVGQSSQCTWEELEKLQEPSWVPCNTICLPT